jgi:hypothetical protein
MSKPSVLTICSSSASIGLIDRLYVDIVLPKRLQTISFFSGVLSTHHRSAMGWEIGKILQLRPLSGWSLIKGDINHGINGLPCPKSHYTYILRFESGINGNSIPILDDSDYYSHIYRGTHLSYNITRPSPIAILSWFLAV